MFQKGKLPAPLVATHHGHHLEIVLDNGIRQYIQIACTHKRHEPTYQTNRSKDGPNIVCTWKFVVYITL